MEYQLAQANIAKMVADLDDPIMDGFVNRLDEINLLADSSDGFIWRLQTDAGNATNIQPYEDPRILLNLSVWASLEALKKYVYNSTHLELLKAKAHWFDKLPIPHMALWWIPKHHIPDIEEGVKKLRLIEKNGSSPDAFTFSNAFESP